MAKIKNKGSVLQLEVASVFTAVGQLISIDGPEMDVETFDSTALDTTGPGNEHDPTGWVDAGELSFEMFFDPVLASHQMLTDLITAPAVKNWKLLFADAATTAWPFAATMKKFSPAIALRDGLKASGSVKLKGIPTLPT